MGQHDETVPGEQRIVISETEAGARPHSILRVTVSSLDSVLQWEVSTCNMLTFFFFFLQGGYMLRENKSG